jgi:hypothetical protein
MSAKTWIPMWAAAALLSACGNRDEPAGKPEVAAETATKDPVVPGDQETTPGGVAGETAATPPGTQPETPEPARGE